MKLSTFAAKLARFQSRLPKPIRIESMSKQHRTRAINKLLTTIEATSNPKVVAELGNVLAKFLMPNQARKPRDPKNLKTPINETKEPTLIELVLAEEKKSKEARKSLDTENG